MAPPTKKEREQCQSRLERAELRQRKHGRAYPMTWREARRKHGAQFSWAAYEQLIADEPTLAGRRHSGVAWAAETEPRGMGTRQQPHPPFASSMALPDGAGTSGAMSGFVARPSSAVPCCSAETPAAAARPSSASSQRSASGAGDCMAVAAGPKESAAAALTAAATASAAAAAAVAAGPAAARQARGPAARDEYLALSMRRYYDDPAGTNRPQNCGGSRYMQWRDRTLSKRFVPPADDFEAPLPQWTGAKPTAQDQVTGGPANGAMQRRGAHRAAADFLQKLVQLNIKKDTGLTQHQLVQHMYVHSGTGRAPCVSTPPHESDGAEI